MEFDWRTLVPAVVAFLASLLVVRHQIDSTVRRFYPEKWFDRKVEAYIKVIESLHLLKNNAENDIWMIDTYGQIPPRDEGEKRAYREAVANLRRLMDMGELLFSQDVTVLFAQVRMALDHDEFGEERYEAVKQMASVCNDTLEKIRPLAKRDLNS